MNSKSKNMRRKTLGSFLLCFVSAETGCNKWTSSNTLKGWKTLRLIVTMLAACVVLFSNAYGDTSPWEGTPKRIQGKIMAIGNNYIIVAEKKVAIVNKTVNGNYFKTIITDKYGNEIDKSNLKVGTIVFARCFIDEDIQKDGFVAAEIHIVSRTFGAGDDKIINKFMNP